MADTEARSDIFMFPAPGVAEEHVAQQQPETELVARSQAGDKDAFGRLYQMYAPLVNAVLLARVPSHEVADLVQEVFILAYRKLGGLREAGAFGAWICAIARNRAAEFHRTKRLMEEIPPYVADGKEVPARGMEVLEVIRKMPETYRETLILRLVEGMSGVEIAERMGMKHESVRVNLHRGMEQLRTKLGIAKRSK
jgi:RNA polymerase sigma-70 factor, ECF subfamily